MGYGRHNDSLILLKIFQMKVTTNISAQFSSIVTSLFLLEDNPIQSLKVQILGSESPLLAGFFSSFPINIQKISL